MYNKFFNKLFMGALVSMHSIFSLLPFSMLQGQITEINEITSIKNYIQDDSLVLLNVGDTLFSPSSMLADNQWREYFVKRVNAVITDPKAAKSIIDEVKGIIVEKVPKVCPEAVTPSFIADLQNNKVPVLGYSQREIATSYAPNNGEITSNHLLKMGIDLHKTLSYYPTDEFNRSDLAFQYGIIFTNKNPLGPSIATFLLSRDTLTTNVILVDDSVDSLKEAEEILETAGIAFQGLRYNLIANRKSSFDHNLAIIEFFAFMDKNQLMTDEEALQIQNNNPNTDYDALLNQWILKKAAN